MGNQIAPVDFSLIIPTYNERDNLPELFSRLDRILSGRSFEVIVVDDDSPDETWLAAEAFQNQYSWLRVIRRRNERGLSSAVICGFRQARGAVLGVMDGDLQHDDTLWPQLLESMNYADFAIATRRAAGGSAGGWTWTRRFTSWVATMLAHGIAQVQLSDPMSGFFAMRRELFTIMDNVDMQPNGYKVLLYLYSRAIQQFGAERLRLREVGYQFRLRRHGASKLSSRVIVEYVLMLLELRFRTRPRLARARLAPATP
jgi:dolichol-phosphate mannosyltransferase